MKSSISRLYPIEPCNKQFFSVFLTNQSCSTALSWWSINFHGICIIYFHFCNWLFTTIHWLRIGWEFLSDFIDRCCCCCGFIFNNFQQPEKEFLLADEKNIISRQEYSRLRCLLLVKALTICFYLGWSGSTLPIRTNIIKVSSKSWLLTCSM